MWVYHVLNGSFCAARRDQAMSSPAEDVSKLKEDEFLSHVRHEICRRVKQMCRFGNIPLQYMCMYIDMEVKNGKCNNYKFCLYYIFIYIYIYMCSSTFNSYSFTVEPSGNGSLLTFDVISWGGWTLMNV